MSTEAAESAPSPWRGEGWGEGGRRHRTAALATSRAKSLRTAQTDAERKLWSILRAGRLNGAKFRRQVPIGRYIADFACPAAKLIVELDGGQHADQVAYDNERTAFLESQGYRVLRFWNNDALTNIEGVGETIAGALSGDYPLPNPSPLQGEGL